MKQVLLSLVFVGLFGVSIAQATNGSGVSVDSSGNVVFSDKDIDLSTQLTNNTFNPSGSIYQASSATNTITLNSGVQCVEINGGVNAGSGTKITFDFQGALQGKEQILNFGSKTNANTTMFQTQSGGEIVFDFASGNIFGGNKIYDIHSSVIEYSPDKPTENDISFKNLGKMTFNLGNYTRVFLTSYHIVNNTSQDSKMTFNIGKHSTLGFISSQGNILNKSGILEFNLDSGAETSSNSGKINIINSAITNINFFKTARTDVSGFDMNIQNKNGGTASINLNQSQVYLYAVSLDGEDSKDSMAINFQKASSVSLGNGTFQNVTLNFESEGNVAFSSGFLTNLTWIDNPQSYSNTITLSSYTEFVQRMDYTVYRNEFAVLEIGTKGDNVGKTGISGNNLTFVVYANLGAKAHLYAKDENGRDDYPLYENNMPVIDKDKKPTIGGQDLGNTYAYSDRVIIHSSQNNQGGVHNIGVVFSYWDYANLSSLSYKGGDVKTEGNIAIASVAKDSKVELNPTSVTIGFNSVETSFEKVSTNDQGIIQGGDQSNPLNTYTTYFLKFAQDVGVAPITQEVTSSVFALNYDLFIANFNSLNKRMGDLRNNPYSQGAWGRIFNGELSNDFGLGSQNNYTTLQAGYDYDFTLSNAKNYLGVAFAYGFSISEMSSNASNALQSREIKDIFSNNIELALYNAYVEDSGLYSDSIAKFSYLLSNFNLTNNGVSESLNVNNYAFQLSEEVGCVFTLGESKEWSITPQAKLSFGYYSDSDLTQVVGDFYLKAKAKSMLMLRARVGAMVGYDFKQYTQDKDISTTLYAGLSYEYDYLSGGDIELTPNMGKATTTKSALSSDGRGVLNLGTNITLKDDIRLYADFQTSFGGKINTDYQINIGARFSFGERGEDRVEENKQI